MGLNLSLTVPTIFDKESIVCSFLVGLDPLYTFSNFVVLHVNLDDFFSNLKTDALALKKIELFACVRWLELGTWGQLVLVFCECFIPSMKSTSLMLIC